MKTLKEKIEIMQAALDGESIDKAVTERLSMALTPHDEWITVADPMLLEWNWGLTNYRVTPKPIECWVNVLDGNNCSTVFNSEEEAKARSAYDLPETLHKRWSTRKFREVIE